MPPRQGIEYCDAKARLMAAHPDSDLLAAPAPAGAGLRRLPIFIRAPTSTCAIGQETVSWGLAAVWLAHASGSVAQRLYVGDDTALEADALHQPSRAEVIRPKLDRNFSCRSRPDPR